MCDHATWRQGNVELCIIGVLLLLDAILNVAFYVALERQKVYIAPSNCIKMNQGAGKVSLLYTAVDGSERVVNVWNCLPAQVKLTYVRPVRPKLSATLWQSIE